jgi:signal transduction histidine kinase/ligand-binding sensor domain-containing protein
MANHMQRTYFILLLASLLGGNCVSQQYPFVHYSPKDGLASNRARFMYQGSNGLLYIATYGGLSVYDGSRFTNYTIDNGLSNNTVNGIVEMGEDSIWIIPNAHKVQCLVGGTIHDVPTTDGFYPVINKMIRCSDGFYYAVADEGLFRFEKNHFTRINLTDISGRDAGHFLENAEEIDGRLFIIPDFGSQVFPSQGHLVVYDIKSKKTIVSELSPIYSVLRLPSGDILAATRQGIWRVDPVALLENKIRFRALPSIYHVAQNLVANYLYTDRQENLWISSIQGVLRIDRSGEAKLFSINNGLLVNSPMSIFQDKENTMWFMNAEAGISKLISPSLEFYNQMKPGFTTSDIFTDNTTDSVWFLDAAHKKLLLQYKNQFKEYRMSGHLRSAPYKLFVTDKNRFYLSDIFHVYQCDISQKKITSRSLLYSSNSHNMNEGLTCMLPDHSGNLAVSSIDLAVLIKNKKNISQSLGYFCDKFVITSDNHLWAATRGNKIFHFVIHPDSPDHYLQLVRTYDKELPAMTPRSITVDKKGNVWIGSRDHGLFCLFFEGSSLRSWRQITTKEGLSDNFISYLHADEDDNIWACSPSGLDKVQLKSGSVFIENTTRSFNLYQYFRKIQTSKEGVHWAQAGAGVIRIAPHQTLPVDFQPKILFREIYEGHNRINSLARPLSLSYQNNDVNFVMAVPSFIDEKQIRFSYHLEGSSNTTWTDPSLQAVINLINLAPGKYTLRAKAIFLDGRYPESEASFSFVIHPPWWQTWWFRTSVVLLTIAFCGLIIRSYYQRKLQNQQIALERQQAIEKERTRIATDMHDDLGAGLSTIRFLGEKVKRNTFSQVTREDVEKMQTTSNELIDKMNEIIWSMSEKNDSLEDLILYIRSYAMEYCEDNNLDCSIRVPESIPSRFLSGETRRNIFLTVKETLHNIVKHAGASEVEINIEVSGALDMAIRDNGIGFHDNFQSRQGNGLRNMQLRIASIGGKLDILHANGVTVTWKVPLAL